MINQSAEKLRKQTRQWHIEQQQSRSVNGFSHAPTIWQIVSILVFFLLCAQFVVMVSYVDNLPRKLGFMSVQLIFAVFVAVCWYLVSAINPADPVHYQHCQAILGQLQFEKPIQRQMCPTCQTYRLPESFHCKKCKKCIEQFDHHCKWVNNCVGSRNYVQFILLLVALLVFLAFNAIVIIYFVVVEVDIQVRDCALRVVSIVSCVLSLLGVVIIGILFGFHIVLIWTGRRTIWLIHRLRESVNQKGELADRKDTENKVDETLDRSQEMKLKPIAVYSPGNMRLLKEHGKRRKLETSKIKCSGQIGQNISV